ncbi:CpaF family protein, partial [Brevundimonas sp. M-11_2]
MFGKRTAQPGVAVAPRPAPAPQPAAADLRALDPVDAFPIEELEADAAPPSASADRLDALAARPRPEAAVPTPGG